MSTVALELAAPKTDPVAALETMFLIRKFEEATARLNAEGKSPSVCTSVGQEASAVGVVSALEARDQILTNHRSAGHLLARGADPSRVLAEILGRVTGYCKGKSGSLHISVRELGVILTSTIVGGELSLAPGVALSATMTGRDSIVACFFGDGAACEGIFHESLNLASVWQLPVLYVCENNQWQAFVHRRETMVRDRVSEWAGAYGVEARTVDGNDVEAVAAAAREAADYVRTERRPYLLETWTYRLRGHMEPDDQSYVDTDELERWRSRDPLTLLEARLIERGEISRADAEELALRAHQTIEDAVELALASPYPTYEEITNDVYA